MGKEWCNECGKETDHEVSAEIERRTDDKGHKYDVRVVKFECDECGNVYVVEFAL